MKNSLLHLLLATLFLMLGIQSFAQHGNASTNHVIQTHYWTNSTTSVYCPATGMIDISFTMHVIEKVLPDGKESWHANGTGEGIDEYGGKWRFHHTGRLMYKLENGMESDLLYMDYILLHGPDGKQLKMKTFVLEKDGEIAVLKSEPMCD